MKTYLRIVIIVFFSFLSFVAINLVKDDNKSSSRYFGEALGRNGTIKVGVVIKNREILDISVIESRESTYTKETIEQLIAEITRLNSLDIDTKSGATSTSNGLIQAIADAVGKSGVNLRKPAVSPKNTQNKDVITDIVIIGAGGAGLSAAIEATNKGAKVILVEKNAFVGGNTNFSNGMNVAKPNSREGVTQKDSEEAFFNRTMQGGHDLNNPELVRLLANKSAEASKWLDSLESKVNGSLLEKNHLPNQSTFGMHLVEVLKSNAELLNIDCRLNSKAISIFSEEGKVNGIEVETSENTRYKIYAKAVIISSGGFGANKNLIANYNPSLKEFSTTNQPGATGDAFQLVKKLDAALIDMNQIQTHPTVVVGKRTTITEGVRGTGAILVNWDGKRFVNEVSTRDTVSLAILKLKSKTAFLIFDSKVTEKVKTVNDYLAEGLLTSSLSIKELAIKIGIDTSEIRITIERYNSFVDNKKDEDFRRLRLSQKIDQPPFYAVEVTPAVHYTMGGLKINSKTEVINGSGQVITGLFVAGEVTGGVHGGNRLGGNSITDIIVFGRIAGKNASSFIRKQTSNAIKNPK